MRKLLVFGRFLKKKMTRESLLNQKILRKGYLSFIPSSENNYRPSFFESRFLFYALFLILVLRILVIPLVLYLPTSHFFAEVTETALFDSINEERAVQGLGLLENDFQLDGAAYAKAQNMLEEGYFAHTSPEGINPWYWFRNQGYRYQYAGENLAIGFLNSREVTKAWMDSGAHRQNILNPNYEDMGLAVVQGEFQGQKTTLVVQLFGTKASVEYTMAEEEVSSFTPPATVEEESLVRGVTEINGEELTGEEKVAEFPSSASSLVPSSQVGFLPDSQPSSPWAFLLDFLNQHYETITWGIVLAFFVLVSLAVFLLIVVRIDQQAPDLIIRGSVAFALLIVFLLFEGEVFLRLFPHHFLIG